MCSCWMCVGRVYVYGMYVCVYVRAYMPLIDPVKCGHVREIVWDGI